MTEVVLRVLVVAFIAAVIVAVAVIMRRMTRSPGLAALFATKPGRRMSVIEQAAIDGKRKLDLVRRDDVEHLVMTGGQVDIVIESGIGAPRSMSEARATPPLRPLRQAAE